MIDVNKDRTLVVRIVNGIGRLGLWLFTPIWGRQYSRFLRLDGVAKRALERGETTKASSLARELLRLADSFKEDWNYGNAIHAGHILLGRVALQNGNVKEASEQLLLAGLTPGSPQLNSFGPKMRLATELMCVGETDAVLKYFDLCREFWTVGTDRLDSWSSQVLDGKTPDFGLNLDL